MPGATSCRAGATQYYYAPQLRGASGLSVVQSAGSVHVPGPGGWIPVRVRGQPGRAARNVITWRAGGLTTCIQVDVTVDAANPNPRVLTTRQLIAIANGASTYGAEPVPV